MASSLLCPITQFNSFKVCLWASQKFSEEFPFPPHNNPNCRLTVEPCTFIVILSTNGINMTWCGYIGLQHIQKSAFQVKSCGLQPYKGSFMEPHLKDPFCPVKWTRSHISAISLLIKMRFGVSKHVG